MEGFVMKRVCEVCGYVDSHNVDECPICKRNQFIDSDIYDLKKISSDESFINAMIDLNQKDPIEFQLKMSQFKSIQQQTKAVEDGAPKCPTCGSTDIVRISTTSKMINIAAFGLLGNKRKKTFHCNDCKYEW